MDSLGGPIPSKFLKILKEIMMLFHWEKEKGSNVIKGEIYTLWLEMDCYEVKGKHYLL